MNIANKPNIITASAVMSATLTSISIPVYLTYSYAIQAVWTGTPTGTFKIQVSCDPATNAIVTQNVASGQTSPTHWSDLSGSSYAVSAAGDYLWNVQDVGYNWVRLIYTDESSGMSTAVLTTSTFNGKAP